jgi:hypothetical protein
LPLNDETNLRLFTEKSTGPNNSLPLGVRRFFNKTTQLNLNLIQEPSNLKLSFLTLTIIAFNLDFRFIQFSAFTSIAELLTKSPELETRRFEPEYK